VINKLEARRQIFHALFGIILALLIYFEIIDFLILFIVAVVGLIVSIISRRYNIPIITWFLNQFDREKDRKRMPGRGAIYYALGALIVYGLFITQPEGKDIVTASIMILALGDSVPLFFVHLGRIKHPFSDVKYIEASLAGVIFAFLGAVFFVRPLEALLASLIAMFVEGIDLKMGLEIDDNLIIPVVAATVIWVLRMLF
jgi:dolichol kinase